MTATCEHGIRIGDNSDIAGVAYAAPFMHCDCCQRDRPYVDEVMMTITADGTTTTTGTRTDQHLCHDCGGRTERFTDPPPEDRDPATLPVGMRGPITDRVRR
jgi:hypothetical protein